MTDTRQADIGTELGRQRLVSLRALAEQTEPGTVLLPDGLTLRLQATTFVEPFVILPARELIAMLDRLSDKP